MPFPVSTVRPCVHFHPPFTRYCNMCVLNPPHALFAATSLCLHFAQLPAWKKVGAAPCVLICVHHLAVLAHHLTIWGGRMAVSFSLEKCW